MAESIRTVSSLLPKNNINDTIPTSTFNDISSKQKMQEITLSQLQTAINKLTVYVEKVNNCGNCYNYTVLRTTCQSVKCQSISCQSATCQSATCQTTSCQSTKYYNHSCSC